MNVIGDIQLSKNFKLSEFICKEGKNEVCVNMKLIEKLQLLRDIVKEPIYVLSGYRSVKYNRMVGGVEKSFHLKGMASDIYCKGLKPSEIIKYANDVGFGGVGLYEDFVHVDIRKNYTYWEG